MTTLMDGASVSEAVTERPPSARGEHWIDHWDPEDEAFWESTGQRIANRNLVFSILSEHIGFSIWVIWTIVVINLGNIGINLSVSEQFTLTLVPN
jgi:NNP family nitrate/nitrite transporter-like MFS transporter